MALNFQDGSADLGSQHEGEARPFLQRLNSTGRTPDPLQIPFMDREYCLRIAEEAAQRLSYSLQGVLGVFVCGSMATRDCIRYADVDLRVIVDSQDPPSSHYEIVQEVPLEWVFVPAERYRDPEELLSTPFLAMELAKGIILHDPKGFLEARKQEIGIHYQAMPYVRKRARRLWMAAEGMFQTAATAFAQGETVVPWDLRCVIFWLGEIPSLLLNRTPNHRRLLVQLRELGVQVGWQEAYRFAIQALGAEDVAPSEVNGFLIDVLSLIDSVHEVGVPHHFHLSQEKRPYWEFGMGELINEGHYQEAIWPMLTLVSSAAPLMASSPQAASYRLCCRNFLHRLGFVKPVDLERKIRTARNWLAWTDKLIDTASVMENHSEIEQRG